jgi:hypothetical protein
LVPDIPKSSSPFEIEGIHINHSSGASVKLLDEVEQTEVINDVTSDVEQQSEEWKQILSFACIGAALASTISYLFLVDDSPIFLLRFHSIYAGALHLFAGWLVSQPLPIKGTSKQDRHIDIFASKNFGRINRLGLLAALLQVPYFKIMHVRDLTVWTLVGMNILTMAAVVYFRVEEQRSLVGVNALKLSTYKHKSL